MQRVMLKSKIHRATVTGSDLHYVGSITIDPISSKPRTFASTSRSTS